jgi:hypothetical protein
VLSYSYVPPIITTLYTGTNITYNYVNGRWASRPYNTSTTDISTAIFTGGINTATSAFALSVGTTNQRTIPQQSGALRFNSSINVVESYSTLSNTWTTVALGALPYAVEYLAIAAGGGASTVSGGGAGGVLAGFTQVTTGNSYTVAVGQGGSGTGGDSYIAPTAVTAISTASTIAVTTGTGGAYSTTLTGLFVGRSAVHSFTSSGFFTATTALTLAHLLVGGGGVGGCGYGGGGGGGGLLAGLISIVSGTYIVTVGAGGSGGSRTGSSSTFTSTSVSLVAYGGGAGGWYATTTGGSGGSGGGSYYSGVFGAATGSPGIGSPGPTAGSPGYGIEGLQGFPGGGDGGGPVAWGGGGGGAGGAGTPGALGRTGGVGLQFGITGTPTYYAGGGGGSIAYSPITAPGGLGGGGLGGGGAAAVNPGTAGLGGGGGAGGCYATSAANGGSGVVILSYALTTASVVTTINAEVKAYAYGGSTGTTLGGGSSGGGVAGQGYPVAQALYANSGIGGTFSTTLTGAYPGESAAVHVFTASGFFTATQAVIAKYLVVAGGGGGGNGYGVYGAGAGGGAGGLLTGEVTMPAGTTYTIYVGAGGTGGTSKTLCGGNATPGTPSVISGTGLSVTVSGGGKGAPAGGTEPNANPAFVGSPGGSGGGGVPAGAGIPGQGFPGGTYPSGPVGGGVGNGGGAGGAGTTGPTGAQGPGLPFNYTGTPATYAEGGIGGPNYNPSPPNPPGYGNGGRGGGWVTGVAPDPAPGIGGNPGVVIITYRYSLPQLAGGGALSSTGTGIYSQVTGAQVTYGAGGIASGSSPGGTNTGNGGSAPNGTGAPGVVYIRYPGSQRGSGGSVSTVGTYTLHTFVSTGTYTA